MTWALGVWPGGPSAFAKGVGRCSWGGVGSNLGEGRGGAWEEASGTGLTEEECDMALGAKVQGAEAPRTHLSQVSGGGPEPARPQIPTLPPEPLEPLPMKPPQHPLLGPRALLSRALPLPSKAPRDPFQASPLTSEAYDLPSPSPRPRPFSQAPSAPLGLAPQCLSTCPRPL